MAIIEFYIEKEADIRELIERGLKLQANLKDIEPLRDDMRQLHAEVRMLNTKKIVGQIQHLMK